MTVCTVCMYAHIYKYKLCYNSFSFSVVSKQLWLFICQVEDSIIGDFYYPLKSTGSPPSLTASDMKFVSGLEVRINPGIT